MSGGVRSPLGEKLHKKLHYDPETGVFTWQVTERVAKKGHVTGYKRSDGYLSVGFNSRNYLAHRLAWFYVHDVWPEYEIDHINGDRTDNRICNLRQATRAENVQNLNKCRVNNISGLLGVSWHRKTGKYQARIRFNGIQRSLGLYSTPEEAHEVYKTEKKTSAYALLNLERTPNGDNQGF